MDGATGNACQVQCRPLRRVGPQDILLVDLHIADAQAPAAGIKPDFAAIHHGAVDEGPRDDSPESLDGERPVDVETAHPLSAFHGQRRCHGLDFIDQFRQAAAADGIGDDDRGPFGCRIGQILADVLQGQAEQHVVDGVGLGDDDDEFMYAKKGQDVEMFFRLRHDPFVGIDDEQDQIEARQAGDHILDELFMPRYIDDAGPRTVRQVEPGKAQVDGQSPFLFFRCRIRIDPGQGPDQRRLAMIDMAGRPDDDMSGHNITLL